jgi:hypothetical protein
MHRKFSQDIESLLTRLDSHPLTFKEILEEISGHGFSLLIGLFSLPFLLPMPPGLGGVLGVVALLLSLQMGLGRREPWLPRQVANYQFPKGFSWQLLKQANKVTKLAEKLTRPRLLFIANNPYIWQLNGLLMAWLSLLLMLPIPLTNSLPTLGILLLVIATLESDGFLMCIAYGWSLCVTLIFFSIFYVLLQTPELLNSF